MERGVVSHGYNPKNAIVIRRLAELRGWFEQNCGRDAGVWAVSYKKGHDDFVSYADIRDEALCFGWIDSKSQRVDEERTAIWLSPRREASPWSGVNKERVAALRNAGRMTPMGEKTIDQAKQDGSWTLFDDAAKLIVPDGLAQALQDEGARSAYDELSPSRRRSMLEGLALAKTDRTKKSESGRW